MNGPAKLIFSALTGVLLLGSPARATEFRSADNQPDDYPTVKAQKYMSDLLSKATNGKDTIKIYANGTLGSEKDSIEQVKLGAIDLLRVNTGTLNMVCKETVVPLMPFIFKDKAHMRRVLDGPIGEDILKSCEAQGMVGLAFYDNGSRSFYTVRKPIKTLDDIKGMKIRVQQSDIWVAMMKALGANATPMPYGEIFTGLKTGLIDGAENNWPSYQTSHHYEVAKYYSLTEHSMAPEMLLMSKKVWDKLTAEEQKAIRETAKASVPYMRKLWDDMEVASRAEVEKSGAQIITVDKAPFLAALRPVYDQFINKDPDLKALADRIMATD
jgi:tripartite ATP-independent transporter DctP family solute receptor